MKSKITLREIRQRVIEANKLQEGESWESFAERKFKSLPRIPYGELPKSLKEEVRKRVSINSLRTWLEETQTWLESENAGDFAWMKGRLDEVLAVDPKEEDPETVRQGKVERLLVRVRNTATYTIDAAGPIGKENPELVPDLYQDWAQCALELLLKKKSDKDEPQPLILPQPTGVSGGSRLKIISDKVYCHAFTIPNQPTKTRPHTRPYMVKMTEEVYKRLNTTEHNALNGSVDFDSQSDAELYVASDAEDVMKTDELLLWQIYTAMNESCLYTDGYVVTIDFPAFMRCMDRDATGNRHKSQEEILSKIYEFDRLLGYVPGYEKPFRVLISMEFYDPQTQTIKLASPYFAALTHAVEKKRVTSGKRKNGESWDYHKPAYNQLCHATLVKERNKPAALLVAEITNRLLQHGTTPDAKSRNKKLRESAKDNVTVTYTVTFRELMNSVTLLSRRIERNKDQNQVLSRAFKRAYELLWTHSDAHLYYRELSVERTIPTMKTLDSKLKITHKGLNPDYVKMS